MAVVLTAQPVELQLDLELVIEGIPFILRLDWNERLARWCFGFWRADQPVLVGRRLVPGVPMNNRYTGEHLPGGVFLSARLDGAQEPVGKDELGRAAFIFYVPREEFLEELGPRDDLLQLVRIEEAP
jgi:hypothetical protein